MAGKLSVSSKNQISNKLHFQEFFFFAAMCVNLRFKKKQKPVSDSHFVC